MKRLNRLLLLLSMFCSTSLYAHTKLLDTMPSDGDVVRAPDSIVLDFAAEVELIAVELKTVVGDETVNLGPMPREVAISFSISVDTTLPPGEYYVVWRSIGADTHVVTGEFIFTVVK